MKLNEAIKMQYAMLKQKHGMGVRDISPVVLTLVVASIFLGIGLYITQSFRDELTAGTEAYTAVNKTVAGLGKFGDWWGLIVIVIISAIIIGIVITSLAGGRK